jgi:hypothetical protein
VSNNLVWRISGSCGSPQGKIAHHARLPTKVSSWNKQPRRAVGYLRRGFTEKSKSNIWLKTESLGSQKIKQSVGMRLLARGLDPRHQSPLRRILSVFPVDLSFSPSSGYYTPCPGFDYCNSFGVYICYLVDENLGPWKTQCQLAGCSKRLQKVAAYCFRIFALPGAPCRLWFALSPQNQK